MKRVILGVLTTLILTSCGNDPYQLNTIDGKYSVTWEAVERSGFLGGYDFDTTIVDMCEIHFDYGIMYTVINDTIQPVPEIGFLYERNHSFYTSRSDTELNIAGEIWTISPSELELTRYTDYYGMGNHTHTMKLTEL